MGLRKRYPFLKHEYYALFLFTYSWELIKDWLATSQKLNDYSLPFSTIFRRTQPVCLSAHLSVCLYVCLYVVRVSVCLSARLTIGQSARSPTVLGHGGRGDLQFGYEDQLRAGQELSRAQCSAAALAGLPLTDQQRGQLSHTQLSAAGLGGDQQHQHQHRHRRL